MSMHLVHGKPTTHGHIVHYTGPHGDSHAALIKHIEATPTGHKANLHVFSSTNGSDNHVESVPHSVTPAPHTWTHIPE
jgi:hypothetical protein